MLKTLLYTVQTVLDKINLDPVNSIDDTEDALLVAKEAKNTFYELMTSADWPDKQELVKLYSYSDTDRPTLLYIKDEVHHLNSVRFKERDEDDNIRVKRLVWKDPEDFMDFVQSRRTDRDDVFVMYVEGTPFPILNNVDPTFYTSFDNVNIILDSWDAEKTDTILGTDTICYGKVVPSWSTNDNFVIPVQDSLYPLYLSMLTSTCSLSLTHQMSPEEERRRNTGLSNMRRQAVRTELETFPRFKYGRRGDGIR